MLRVAPYREQGYPPGGWQWVQFGDPKLDEAFTSISEDMHTNLAQKKKDWQMIHMDRLEQKGLAPTQRPPPPDLQALKPKSLHKGPWSRKRGW